MWGNRHVSILSVDLPIFYHSSNISTNIVGIRRPACVSATVLTVCFVLQQTDL